MRPRSGLTQRRRRRQLKLSESHGAAGAERVRAPGLCALGPNWAGGPPNCCAWRYRWTRQRDRDWCCSPKMVHAGDVCALGSSSRQLEARWSFGELRYGHSCSAEGSAPIGLNSLRVRPSRGRSARFATSSSRASTRSCTAASHGGTRWSRIEDVHTPFESSCRRRSPGNTSYSWLR
jgi:hypothetical protein